MHSKIANENFSANVTSLLLFISAALFTCFVIWHFFNLKKIWRSSKRKLPPGPVGVPIFGALPFLGSEPHKTLIQMRKKYGDIIGLDLGPNYTVVINEYTAAQEIYKNPDTVGRPLNYFEHVPQIGFLTANGGAWTEQRRFLLTVLKELGVGRKTWGDMATEEARNYVEFLREAKGEPLEIEHSLRESLVYNLLYFLLGRRVDKHKDADKIHMMSELARLIFSVNGTADVAFTVPGLWRVLTFFNVGKYGEVANIADKCSKFLQSEISNFGNNKNENVSNLLSTYMEELIRLRKTGNNNHHFSENMLEGNMTAVLTATLDTTTSSIYWLIRLMSEHKDVQSRVYKEVMEVLGKDGVASYDERQKIPYTFAVLMEAQRFSSIVPLTSPRLAYQDINVRGLTIPRGTAMTLNLWAMHHDPQYWEEPDMFKPERFLIENGTKLMTNTTSFIPFSIGRRNCPGMTIAWRQILAYFTEIIKIFEISTVPGEKTEYKISKGLVTSLEPQNLCFKERSV